MLIKNESYKTKTGMEIPTPAALSAMVVVAAIVVMAIFHIPVHF